MPSMRNQPTNGIAKMDPHAFVQDLEVFKKISPDMQISTLLTFLYVARRGRCYQKDIEIELGLSNAAASRNISYWTDQKYYGRPGFGLLRREEDPRDRRNKMIVLTDKGRAFYESMRGRSYVSKATRDFIPSGPDGEREED
jgi:DNA-binding MarR family transcriptional regulator